MGDIYRNGLVTIAAAAVANSDGGMLFERSLGEDTHLRISVRAVDGATGSVFIGGDGDMVNAALEDREYDIERSIHFEDPQSWVNQKTVLDSRGWTLQESILSTRLVKFTDHQLFFTCRTIVQREDGACHINEGSEGDYVRNFTQILRKNQKRREGVLRHGSEATLSAGAREELKEIHRSTMETWYILLRQYMRRELTYATDKLPALAGIAAYMEEAVQLRYLAGIWDNDLESGLAWRALESEPGLRASGGRETEIYTRVPGAPSWSWASVESTATGGFESSPKTVPPLRLLNVLQSGNNPADVILEIEGFVRIDNARDVLDRHGYKDPKTLLRHGHVWCLALTEATELLLVPTTENMDTFERIGIGETLHVQLTESEHSAIVEEHPSERYNPYIWDTGTMLYPAYTFQRIRLY